MNESYCYISALSITEHSKSSCLAQFFPVSCANVLLNKQGFVSRSLIEVILLMISFKAVGFFTDSSTAKAPAFLFRGE
jgi:hypothetical protein